MCAQVHLAEVVESTAGRDKGNYYIVVAIFDDQYVMVANGDSKKVKHAKRKNRKHLKPTGIVNKEIAIWLSEGKRIRDEDIKKIIRDYENNEEAQ